MKNNKIVKYLRWGILASILVFMTVQGYLHQVLGGGKAASIHALCPYGGLESLYSLIIGGSFIKKIYTGTMALFVITIVLAIAFKRSFCGLLCPFGALQELFGMLGRKVFGKNFTMPKKIDKPLRYLKYVILVITAIFAWKTAELWMSPYDPWAAYAHLSAGPGELFGELLIGFIILLLTLIGSLLYDRFFCKYLCPMGAFYGIVAKISPNKIVRNEDTCINCGICSKKCPVNIDVAHSKQITSAECINCLTCILSCPKAGAIEIREAKKTLSPAITIALVMAIFFGGILVSKAAGLYQTLPQPLTQGQLVQPGGVINVDEIKGYMTLKEVSEFINMDIKEVYKNLKLPENVPADTRLKEVSQYVEGFTPDKAKGMLK